MRLILLLLFILNCFLGIALASGDPWRNMGIIKREELKIAHDFTLPTPDGKEITLSELRGKAVMVNFWATWCIPCRTEMPSMERLYKIFKESGFTILAVNFMENEEKVKQFVKEKALTFPVVIDRDGKISQLYRASALPVTYFIDNKGRVSGVAFGAREWDGDAALELIEVFISE
jgi:peroxiredoxin